MENCLRTSAYFGNLFTGICLPRLKNKEEGNSKNYQFMEGYEWVMLYVPNDLAIYSFSSFALLLSINHNQSNVIEFRWKAGWNIEFQFGTYGTIMSLSMKPDNRCWNMIPCLTHTMCVLCGFYGHNFSMMIDFSLFQFNWSKVQTKWINHSWKPRAMNISNILKSIKLKFFMNILHF